MHIFLILFTWWFASGRFTRFTVLVALCTSMHHFRTTCRGDSFLVEFCKQFEEKYLKKFCTPNMHLYCHIAGCLRDHFSFERCNGILGGFPNNNKSLGIEKTIMKKFIQQIQNPTNDTSEIAWLFPNTLTGSLCVDN